MCVLKARIILLSCLQYVCFESKNYSAKLSRICVQSKQELKLFIIRIFLLS